MAAYTVGSLFSGYGGLDLGVTGALGPGGDTLFVSDVEKGPCAILAHRLPDAPNIGDITAWIGGMCRELTCCVAVRHARTCPPLARDPA